MSFGAGRVKVQFGPLRVVALVNLIHNFADLKRSRAVQSSRTAFVLETIVEKGGLGPLEDALVAEEA